MRGEVFRHACGRFVKIMLLSMAVMSILVMWSLGWNWGRWHEAEKLILEWAVLIGAFVAVGILRGHSVSSNEGVPFAGMFKRLRTWPRRMSGWQRVLVVLSGICTCWWMIYIIGHGTNISFFGGVFLALGAFISISLLSLFALWVGGLVFRWVKAGFNRT